jgi:hypothetical protein
MVSESNTNRRHLRISNTHDQIHYNNNTSKLGGAYSKEYPIKICSISDGSRHGVKYICIWKYLNTFKVFVFDV